MINFFKKLRIGEKIERDRLLDNFGLSLLGLFSLAYIIFFRDFAELHIKFSFLDFPVFVGEILLFICLLILVLKWPKKPPEVKLWHYFLFFYCLFFLAKAFYGYFKWGPLAFRHSALFYYPLFAIFSYTFYQPNFFSKNKQAVLALSLIIVVLTPFFYDYFFLTCLLLIILLIKNYPFKTTKYLFFLPFIFFPYQHIFYGSRTQFLANIVTLIYLAAALFFTLKIKKSYKLAVVIAISLFLSAGVLLRSGDKNIKPLANIKGLIRQYQDYDALIIARKQGSEMKGIIERITKDTSIRIYRPEKVSEKKLILSAEQSSAGQSKELIKDIVKGEKKGGITKGIDIGMATPNLFIEVVSGQTLAYVQYLEKTYDRTANIFFRLFIWRDMLKDLRKANPSVWLAGFDFGKPFRSESIEYLYWAVGDWSRDGWIAAHNSYLEIIYRAGLLGILFIGTAFVFLFKLIKQSIKTQSLNGILLSAALLNWLLAANFLMILELPYTAIPFWSLFGISYAHLKKFCKPYKYEVD